LFFGSGFCVSRPFSPFPPFSGQPFIFGPAFFEPFIFGQPFFGRPFGRRPFHGKPFIGQRSFSPWGWFGGIDAIDASDEPLMAERELGDPPSTGSKLIVVDGQRGGAAVEVRQVGGDTIQLTRPGSEAGVRQVTLFLADSLRHTLDEQTLSTAPYTVNFTLAPATAFVGVTVTYTNGTIATTTVPYVPVLR
jgi:hypothetical protein